MPSVNTFSQPGIERRWKKSSGEPDGDAGDPYTGYDRFGRTERMRWIKGSSSLVDVQWGYNQASLKTWRRDLVAPTSADQDQSFGYDGLYQVVERKQGLLNTNATSIAGVPAQEELFSYDETGNWVQYRKVDDGVSEIDQTRVNNQSNQILQVDGLSTGVSYDANGNMLLVPTGDALEGAPRKLTWDAWNRLRTVKDSNNVTLGDYQYDARFRRITTAANGATQHVYFNDHWRSVEERLDSSASAERQYVWHPTNRWDLILRDRSPSNNGTLSERLYSLKDQLDVVATCNSSGVTQERFSYSAFGEPTFLNAAYTVQSTSPALWTFLFHAEFGDIDTGWYNYGYRFYVPSLGRWPSRDPILEAGGQNLQAFCFSDAVNWYDVSGKNPQKPVNPRTDGDLQPGPNPSSDCAGHACGSPTQVGFKPENKTAEGEIDCDKECPDPKIKVKVYYPQDGGKNSDPDRDPPFHAVGEQPDGRWTSQDGRGGNVYNNITDVDGHTQGYYCQLYPEKCEGKLAPPRIEVPPHDRKMHLCMSFQKVIVLFVVIGGALLVWVIDKGISVSLERKRSIESFNECVDNWRLNVQSHYIKTEFSESPILDPSYSGSWVAFEGSSAEALFDHPLLKDSNPARFLLNQLNDLEPVFSRMHRIRIKNPDALSSKDAARLDGVFMPLFQQR